MASNYLTLNTPLKKLGRRMLRAPVTGGSQPASTTLLRWEDIDDSQTLDLGGLGGTSLVFTKDSERPGPNYFALRSYNQAEFTPERRRLIELASADENLFLEVHCLFDHNRKVYVGTELSDMSLADIIDCTMPINEVQLSAVLGQVSSRINYGATTNTPRLLEPLIIFIPQA